MNDAAPTQVAVDYRNIRLTEATSMIEAAEGNVFVRLDDPPPVRTVLAIREGDAEARALEIVRVVEVADQDGERGLLGRFVETSTLERNTLVGTEHLPAGTLEPSTETSPTRPPSDDQPEASPTMAVPAPVMDPDPSEAIDVDPASAAQLAAQEHGDANEAAETPPEGEVASDGEGSRRKRRGRKRRG